MDFSLWVILAGTVGFGGYYLLKNNRLIFSSRNDDDDIERDGEQQTKIRHEANL